MKLRSVLILTALFGAASAYGATTPPASTTPAPAAHHASSKSCNRKADAKKLTGDARTSFVKDCRAGKTEASK